MRKLLVVLLPLPLGEVAKPVGFDGEGEPTPRSAAANAVSRHDPTREKVNRENPQIFPIYKL